MEERIKSMYNDCWFIYKSYLQTHDMKKYNDSAAELMNKYERQTDICNLLLWWAPRINTLHDEWRGMK